ncbi:MAG: class I SAM-dependent methyltransferase [Bacteroidota bacterium]
MKSDHFWKTKSLFKKAIQQILSVENNLLFDEAALPAYAHKNPLIDYLFWERLAVVDNFIQHRYPYPIRILDFGCGTGVMSYMLSNKHLICANDLKFSPLRAVWKKIQFPDNVQFVEGDIRMLDNLSKVEVVVALDVLEHMSEADITSYFHYFMDLLQPNGILLISGPTENRLYQIGRKLAGKRFTGSYHTNDIDKIIKQLNTFARVEVIADLVWPISLFKIIKIEKS